MKKDFVVGLDIGTTKIAVMVARKNEYGKIEVLGIGNAPSAGVMRGSVFNIDKTVESIKVAVEEAELRSGYPIKEVYVGIAGQHIKSFQRRGEIIRTSDEEITQAEIDEMIALMEKIQVDPGEEILHVIPQEFIVDNLHGVQDPVGMSGRTLAANFHVITGDANAIKNIMRSVHKAGLEVKDLILEPLASSSAVLDEKDCAAGVALVDIGGGTTDIAIYQDNVLRHTAVIALGGNIITEDIQGGCVIIEQQAKKLKEKFGSALASENKEDAIISIPGLRGRPAKEISLRNLSGIIQARMTDILENVLFEIKSSGFEKKLIAGIVLTGGGSNLKHTVLLTEYITHMDTRLGYPTEHLASTSDGDISNPQYATVVGLIIMGLEQEEQQTPRKEQKQTKAVDEVKEEQTETSKEETKEEKVKKEKKKKEKNPLVGFKGFLDKFMNDIDE